MLRCIFFLTLLLVSILSGCGGPGKQTVSGISQSSTSFSSGSGGVPGIDFATVNRITLKAGPPEGVTFVIWTDLSSSGGHGGTRPGTNARESFYEGKITGSGGRQVTFRVDTVDGVSGVLSIDGEDLRFNTTDGELILISTADGTLRAKQFEFDVSQVPIESTELAEFARSNETISSFFQPSPPTSQGSPGGGTDESPEEFSQDQSPPATTSTQD